MRLPLFFANFALRSATGVYIAVGSQISFILSSQEAVKKWKNK